jgi:regulator of sigma E protease
VTGFAQSIITILLFILILGALVVIHELGHFITARLFNVRVLEFGVGFPPRAKVLRNRGETVYTLNWLPIGGFVKLEGEDGDTSNDPRSFSAQSLPKRLLILVAGVAMNVLLALAIFTGIALMGDPTFGIKVGVVQPESPAAAAGIVAGDVIASVDGQYYGAFSESSALEDLRAKAGQTVVVGIETVDGGTKDVTATLRTPAEVAADKGALGVSNLSLTTTSVSIHHGFTEALQIGVQRTIDALGLILRALGTLVNWVVNGLTGPPPVSGPVGIGVQLGDIFWQLGPLSLLYLAGLLSANLAVVNILPFPPLDGGRMLMITLKRFFGERISLRAERLTYMVGFVFLFAFLIWVTGYDIIRSLGGGGT